jgi:hypothetical protein
MKESGILEIDSHYSHSIKQSSLESMHKYYTSGSFHPITELQLVCKNMNAYSSSITIDIIAICLFINELTLCLLDYTSALSVNEIG